MTDASQQAPRSKYAWRDFLTEAERAYLASADAARPVTFREREDWRRRFAERPRIVQRGFCRARAATKKGGAA